MRSRLHLLMLVVALISASTFGGVNRWTSHGPEGGSVYAMAVDPTDEATVYTGTDHGVYKSENGGALWKPMTKGLSDQRVSALMIAPEDHSRIYAGTTGGKVFQSRDAGANWKKAENGLPKSPVGKIDVAIAGSDSKRIYALM